MEDREWMYMSWRGKRDYDMLFVVKVEEFLEHAFGESAEGHSQVYCPCSRCDNKRRKDRFNMGQHIVNLGFTPGYHRWIHHGEAHRIREEVVRPRLEAFDDEAGVPDMMDDYHQAQFADCREKEEMEAASNAFYNMLKSAQRPLHDRTNVSQLDAVGRVMGLKAELNLSREGFDKMLAVWSGLLPEGYIMPKNLYESEKVLLALKMPYDKIHVCPKGCVLFRKEYADAKYCPKCLSSRYVEVDSGNGQKKQLTIPMRVLRHLPFLARLQRLFMMPESAKQMTWHKNGTRYNPGKTIHPSNAEAWKHFDSWHPDKAVEARNVRVALATDGFNPYGMMSAPYTCWPVFVIPLNHPPASPFNETPCSCC